MGNSTLRLNSDARRTQGPGSPFRRWLAVGLVLTAVAVAWFVFRRDVTWPARSRDAYRLGATAAHVGNFSLAREHFETALANHPYDWTVHHALANVLFHQLNDQDNALRHYLYTLAYSPDPAVDETVRAKIDVIRLMRAGELENPHDALEDMFLAVENDAEAAFRRRVVADNGAPYWQAWKARGRGRVTNMRITSSHDGFYDSVLEIAFPDDTGMAMHFLCPLRDVWRLELSFP